MRLKLADSATKKWKIWIQAARPQTLAAGFVPVLVGASLAIHDHAFLWLPTLVALTCALLIQVGTNFANDYFDHKKGADTEERIGFERVTAKGLVSEGEMLKATVLIMVTAFLMGLYLVWHAGWVILGIGLLSLLFGVLYTGGPFPLGYNGLGDIFVFIFFGFVAVMGTYYVNAFEWSYASIWASIPIGALSTNILAVNNLRDIEQDRAAGKRTIGVLLGENALRWEYTLMLGLAAAVPPHFYFRLGFSWQVLLPLLSLPFAFYLLKSIWRENDKKRLNKTLEQSAQFMTLFSILFSLGIIFG